MGAGFSTLNLVLTLAIVAAVAVGIYYLWNSDVFKLVNNVAGTASGGLDKLKDVAKGGLDLADKWAGEAETTVSKATDTAKSVANTVVNAIEHPIDTVKNVFADKAKTPMTDKQTVPINTTAKTGNLAADTAGVIKNQSTNKNISKGSGVGSIGPDSATKSTSVWEDLEQKTGSKAVGVAAHVASYLNPFTIWPAAAYDVYTLFK